MGATRLKDPVVVILSGVQKVALVVNNSIAFVNSDIQIQLKANHSYGGIMTLIIQADTIPDSKYNILLPAGSTDIKRPSTLPAWGTVASTSGSLSQTMTSGGSGVQSFTLYFAFRTGDTVDKLILQFAQDIANASDTKLHPGSQIILSESVE